MFKNLAVISERRGIFKGFYLTFDKDKDQSISSSRGRIFE